MKAVLFDLHGVLIDSFDPYLIAFNKTMEKCGRKKVSKREFMEKYIGSDDKAIIKKFGFDDDATKYMRAVYLESVKDTVIFPGVRKILESLSKKVKLGVVTNTWGKYVHKTLEYFDLKKYFDVIVTIDDVENGKPHPEMIIKACKSLGLDPSEVVAVGDEKNDILAAKSAGCFVIGLNIDADYKIKKLSELVKFVDQSLGSRGRTVKK